MIQIRCQFLVVLDRLKINKGTMAQLETLMKKWRNIGEKVRYDCWGKFRLSRPIRQKLIASSFMCMPRMSLGVIGGPSLDQEGGKRGITALQDTPAAIWTSRITCTRVDPMVKCNVWQTNWKLFRQGISMENAKSFEGTDCFLIGALERKSIVH